MNNLAIKSSATPKRKRDSGIKVVRFNQVEPEPPKPISSKARPYNGGGHPAGQSSEVYAFRTEEEIKAMIDVFDKRIENARDKHLRQIAERDKLLFVVGISVGLRSSDLRLIRFNYFFERQEDGELKWREFYTVQPKKQRRQKKFVKLYFNDTVKKAVEGYIEKYPFKSLDDYVFASREGDEPITSKTLWRIIKNTAREAGLPRSYGSHSLRKTFGALIFDNAKNQDKALIVLQQIFNHSSPQVTARYIGLVDEDVEEAFNSINIDIDDL